VLYFPSSPAASTCCLLVRSHGDLPLAKRTIEADLDRDAPGAVDRMDRLETFVAGAVYPYRVAYLIAGVLGLIALGLTAVGVYGVVAFVVGQRTREISIRIALGATTRDVLALVLRQAARHATVGVAIGLTLAIAVARLIASNVQGMPSFDPTALLIASVFVFATCICAAFIPSRRATTINPNESLRSE
jgi:putative ABC transport system permease protein